MAIPGILSHHRGVRYAFMAVHILLSVAILLVGILIPLGYDASLTAVVMFAPPQSAFILFYLIPAAVLCMRNRESSYERGWVELLYITYQFGWSIVIVAFSFADIFDVRPLQVLAVIHTVLLLVWFVWTVWLATEGAKLMGSPWTRNLVLKKVGMSRLVRLPQWRENSKIGLGQMDSNA